MYRTSLIFVFLCSLSGCIKLQMPDDLISDTVDAIKGSDDEPAQDDAGNTIFTHSVVGALDSPVADLKNRCLSELETRTAELLDTNNLTFTVVSEKISVNGDKAIASCTASIE